MVRSTEPLPSLSTVTVVVFWVAMMCAEVYSNSLLVPVATVSTFCPTGKV